MGPKGIRILDKHDRVVSVKLPDILKEINNGAQFHWTILCLEAMGPVGTGQSTPAFEKQIDDSENGLFISWDDIKLLAQKFSQIIDITIIGSKDVSLLHCYNNDREMYEACDFVIEMIDTSYWEVFSKDEDLIQRLSFKFKEIKLLEPDFEK